MGLWCWWRREGAIGVCVCMCVWRVGGRGLEMASRKLWVCGAGDGGKGL